MLILYAPDSIYAAHWEPFLGADAFLFEEEREPGSPPSDGSSSSSPGTGPSSSRNGSPQSPSSSGPTCGQYCAGPVNLCTGNDGCKCFADPYQGTGSGYFTGTCKTPYFSGDSGRELTEIGSNTTLSANSTSFALPLTMANSTHLACPCNCTYVSSACCTSDSGIVFEAPNKKLGMLEPPNSTTFCNTSTGGFEELQLMNLTSTAVQPSTAGGLSAK